MILRMKYVLIFSFLLVCSTIFKAAFASNLIELVEELDDLFPDHFPCIGDTLTKKGGFQISVQGCEFTKGSGLIHAQDGEIYIVIDLYMHNGSNTSHAISSLLQFAIIDNEGFKYNNVALYKTGSNLPEGEIPSGNSIKGQISYVVPENDISYPILLRFDGWASIYLHNKVDFFSFLASHYYLQGIDKKKKGTNEDDLMDTWYKSAYWGVRAMQERSLNSMSVKFSAMIDVAAINIMSSLYESKCFPALLSLAPFFESQKSYIPQEDWEKLQKVQTVLSDGADEESITALRISGYRQLGIVIELGDFAIEGLNLMVAENEGKPKNLGQIAYALGSIYDFAKRPAQARTYYNKCLKEYKQWMTQEELSKIAQKVKKL